MEMKIITEHRRTLIHMLRSGKTLHEAAVELGRSLSWCYKWKERYEQEGWSGLEERSKVPRQVKRKTSEKMRMEILRIRSELEAEAQGKEELGYIGGDAIYGRLREEGYASLPSVCTIERILHRAGVTRVHLPKAEIEVEYPHLQPEAAHRLTQVDIVPHYLSGGECIACFNGIDVVSRYPVGEQYSNKRSKEAVDFLVCVWNELGISEYLQMDNESCFSGGFKHPGVVGQAVRLALFVGVQPIFSPFYHPESNGSVERFHQDYSKFVWEKEHLENLSAVHQRSGLLFSNFRHSHHHSALAGHSPVEIHQIAPVRKLPAGFSVPSKLPITAGQIHFMRAVDKKGNVFILNKLWSAGAALPDQGIWATLFLRTTGASLRIYDAAPGVPNRRCIAAHPFPLKEKVVPLLPEFMTPISGPSWRQILTSLFKRPSRAPSTMS
jgi:transposase